MTKVQTKLTEMDKLMNEVKDKALPKPGDLIEGDVIYVGRNEILVDVGGITTGLIRGHEAYDESGEYSNISVGDHISATVIDLENERGLLELSVKQAGHKKAWDRLDKLKSETEICRSDSA